MFNLVDTRVPHEVEAEIFGVYREMFPDGEREFVGRAFDWVTACFEGKWEDYQAIDARYHDLEHTLQGTLCFARLLQGRHGARVAPRLTRRMFELGLLAMLLHDTGYLKRRNDLDGTGAKYTLVHVSRSANFAKEFLLQHGYSVYETTAVQNMIRCTGVNTDLDNIPFQGELERIVGYALGTADLLGQMAAFDYVDKLPVLYSEFEEAAAYSGSESRAAAFTSAEDLMSKTPGFWTGYVQRRIKEDFAGLHTYLNDPYPEGPNQYLQRIEKNLSRLQGVLAGDSRPGS